MAPSLTVRITDALRLAGALLAAGGWPDQEQAAKAYKPHRVAEAARRYFAPHRAHPAVPAATGLGPAALYAAAATGAWPAGLAELAADFAVAARPQDLWATTAPAWTLAEQDLCAVLGPAGLAGFLEAVFGPLPLALAVYPNLLYPGRQAVVFEARGELVVGQPPPPAWGSSPPWRYRERPDEVLAGLATTAAEALFERLLPAEHVGLRSHAPTFARAAAVLFLRQAEGAAAGDQFMLMEKQTRRLPQLPAVVAVLEAALKAGPRRLGEYVAEMGSVLQTT